MFKQGISDEELYILQGKSIGKFWYASTDMYTYGIPAAVTFDPDYFWDERNKFIGWIHTHPNMRASPSATDIATMSAWCNAMGKPMLCLIDGKDGLRAFWFIDDEHTYIEVKVWRIRNRLFGKMPSKSQLKKIGVKHEQKVSA